MHPITRKTMAGATVGAALMMAWFTGAAPPARAAMTVVGTFGGLQAAVATAASGDTIVIDGDIMVTDQIKVPDGVSLTLTSDTGTRVLTRDPAFMGTMLAQRGNDPQVTLTIAGLILDGGSPPEAGTALSVAGGLVAVRNSQLVLGVGAVLQNNFWHENYCYKGWCEQRGGSSVTVTDGSLTMTGDAKVADNQADKHAAVSIIGGKALITDRAVVSGNAGGGVMVKWSESPSVSDTERPGSLVVNGDALITGNETSCGGGGIHVAAQSVVTLGGNAVVSRNVAAGGGGVALYGMIDMEGDPAHARQHSYVSYLTVTDNAKIIDNLAVGYGIDWMGCYMGGAVIPGSGGGVMGQGAVDITLGGHAQIKGNLADGQGGGIGLNSSFGYGAGTVVAADSASIEGNAAMIGGGVDAMYLGDVTLRDNARISNNQAAAMAGGLVFEQGGVLHVTDNAAITGNSTTGTWVDTLSDQLDLIVRDTVTDFSLNDAETGEITAAGGVYMGRLSDDLPDYGEPGAIHQWDGILAGLPTTHTLLIDGDAVISGNTALAHGGGVAIAYGVEDPVLIEGRAAITGNAAPDGDGGGVYVATHADANLPDQDMTRYETVQVGPAVTFSHNSASEAYQLAQADRALYEANVQASIFTAPFQFGFNNYDINYTNGSPARFVTYDANQGSGLVPDIAVAGAGETVGVAFDPQPTVGPGAYGAEGAQTAPDDGTFVFLGWSTDPGATEPMYSVDGATSFLMGDVNVTLFATWGRSGGSPAGPGGGPAGPDGGRPFVRSETGGDLAGSSAGVAGLVFAAGLALFGVWRARHQITDLRS